MRTMAGGAGDSTRSLVTPFGRQQPISTLVQEVALAGGADAGPRRGALAAGRREI